jgi:hypothetical protein
MAAPVEQRLLTAEMVDEPPAGLSEVLAHQFGDLEHQDHGHSRPFIDKAVKIIRRHHHEGSLASSDGGRRSGFAVYDGHFTDRLAGAEGCDAARFAHGIEFDHMDLAFDNQYKVRSFVPFEKEHGLFRHMVNIHEGGQFLDLGEN